MLRRQHFRKHLKKVKQLDKKARGEIGAGWRKAKGDGKWRTSEMIF